MASFFEKKGNSLIFFKKILTNTTKYFLNAGREICKAYNEATDIDAKKKCDKYFQIVEDTKYVPTFSRVSEIANISLRISVFDFHRQNENAETKISPHNLKVMTFYLVQHFSIFNFFILA